MLRTPLYDACVKAGGRMVDFHGWELPVQFAGVIAECAAVRNGAGIFDVSHMGRFFVEGPGAHAFLQSINCNDIKAEDGEGTYSHLLNAKGGVIDDIIAFCLKKNKFLVVVNSATKDKDLAWFLDHAKDFQVTITDHSSNTGMVAVQGPGALALVEPLFVGAKNIKRFHIMQRDFLGDVCYVTRTGYTGEDGVEIIAPPLVLKGIWDYFLKEGVTPCGLGARDVLRLEAGYLLYGNDVDEKHTSYEASCSWVVKLKKPEDFIGKAALIKQKEKGLKQKLTYFRLTGAGVPRAGMTIHSGKKKLGVLTSGTYSPLFKGIACGYVKEMLAEGAEVFIKAENRQMPAEVVKKFYHNKV